MNPKEKTMTDNYPRVRDTNAHPWYKEKTMTDNYPRVRDTNAHPWYEAPRWALDMVVVEATSEGHGYDWQQGLLLYDPATRRYLFATDRGCSCNDWDRDDRYDFAEATSRAEAGERYRQALRDSYVLTDEGRLSEIGARINQFSPRRDVPGRADR